MKHFSHVPRWVQWTHVLLFLFAATGLLLSILVHFSTFFGYAPVKKYPVLVMLHLGIFVVFFIEIGVSKRNELKIDEIPNWIKNLLKIFFVYTLINFALFSILNRGGIPEKRSDGSYVLTSHGRKIRELTEQEFHTQQAYEDRGFSGHWMLFYTAGLLMIYSNLRDAFRMPSADELSRIREEHDWNVRREAIKELRSKQHAPTIQHLLTLLQEDEQAQVRSEAITAVHSILDSTVWNGFRRVSLINEDAALRTQIIVAFGSALNDESAQIRRKSAIALGKIPDIRTIPLLLKALGDPYRNVRQEATAALAQQCVFVHTVIFGNYQPSACDPEQTLWNPDVTHLTVAMPHLIQVVIHADTHDFHAVERFVTYAVNYLGQKRLKKQVAVHVYGNPAQLHPNLRNNFANLCQQVVIHADDSVAAG